MKKLRNLREVIGRPTSEVSGYLLNWGEIIKSAGRV